MAEETIYTALLKVQEEIRNPENTATNPSLKNKYAPLPDILNMVRPILNRNNIILLQEACGDEDGVYVITRLLHTSGEEICTESLYLKPRKNTPQEAGGAITYARRYQLTSILGIAGETDTDGEGTTKDEVKSKPAPSKKAPASSKPAKTKKTPKSATKQSDVLPDYDTVSKESAVFRLIQEEIKKRDLLLCDDNIIEVGSDMVGKQEITPGDFTVVRRKLGIEV